MAPPLPWLWTVNQVLNAAAVECGLDEAADAYASTLTHFKQLRALLKTCGLELTQARDWKVLIKEGSFTGDGVTTDFDLPADFARFMDQSAWNRTDSEPLSSPLTSQGWQYLKAWTTSATIKVYWRMVGGRMRFYNAIANGETVYYDYVSRYWIAATASSTADKRDFTATDDVVMFDPLLVTKLLKWKFLDMKGQPQAATALEEYRAAFEGAAGNEPAAVLSLGSGGEAARFLDATNLPDTGYGA